MIKLYHHHFFFTDEEKLDRAIKDIKAEEEEKREVISQEGSNKLIEMEANIESLKSVSAHIWGKVSTCTVIKLFDLSQLLLEKDTELSGHKEAESETVKALEELQKIEVSSRSLSNKLPVMCY
jgi:hypothetical protein